MQSVGRRSVVDDDDTECKRKRKTCDVCSQQSFSQWRLLKQCKILFFSRTSNFIDDEEFFVLSDLSRGKHLLSVRRLFNMDEMTESRVSVRV